MSVVAPVTPSVVPTVAAPVTPTDASVVAPVTSSVLLSVVAPLTRAVPVTSSVFPGVVVPMPTCPVESTVTAALPPVLSVRSCPLTEFTVTAPVSVQLKILVPPCSKDKAPAASIVTSSAASSVMSSVDVNTM